MTTRTTASTLCMEVPGREEGRVRRVAEPHGPLGTALDDEEVMADVQRCERPGEGFVLGLQPVSRPRVEPEVRVISAQGRCDPRQQNGGAVPLEPRGARAEDRAQWVGVLVPRPALEHG